MDAEAHHCLLVYCTAGFTGLLCISQNSVTLHQGRVTGSDHTWGPGHMLFEHAQLKCGLIQDSLKPRPHSIL